MNSSAKRISSYATIEKETIIIGNLYLERHLVARLNQHCLTTAFLNKKTGRDYLRPGSHEFCLTINDQAATSLDFQLNKVVITEGDAVEAVLHLFSEHLEIAVELHFQAYDSHPVMRKWLVIRNIGSGIQRLSDLFWEDLNLLVNTPASAEIWADYFSRRTKSIRVTMDECALLVNDTELSEGFIFASEAPGPLKHLEVYSQPSRIAAGYNPDDETIFEYWLAPGESFKTPASFLLVFSNPIPQDVIDGDYADFVSQHLTICPASRVPSVTVNTWIPHLTNIDHTLLCQQIDCAAEMGVDAYQVDDGWYDLLGDWNADPEKFPHGLEAVAEHCHSRGMRFGLWMAVASVHENSQVCQEHPDWLSFNKSGQPNRHPVPGAVTMCLDSDYYDFILAKIDRVIRRYHVELLKLDFSALRNVYAPGQQNGCYAQNHAHHSANESHVRILQRLFDLVRTLKQRHPDCLVDISYELYGVVDGTDLALIQVADQAWFTNLTTPNEVSLRREIYQRARVTRPWTLNYGGTVINDPSAAQYGLFTALTGHACFWGDLADIDPELRSQHYRMWFDWVKEQRQSRDYYAYYQVSNVFPPPDGISTRDYRHALPTARYGVLPIVIHPQAFQPTSESRGETWDGVARLDKHGEGPVFLFRPAACWADYFQLRLPWVEPASYYQLTDVTEGQRMCLITGAELIDPGIEVNLPEPATAKVILIKRLTTPIVKEK